MFNASAYGIWIVTKQECQKFSKSQSLTWMTDFTFPSFFPVPMLKKKEDLKFRKNPTKDNK
jgi:hypothetical protein